MQTSGNKTRFGGIQRLYGDAALERFIGAHVLVIGIGGVGSWVAEGLARSGIGAITLMDLDDICITNTNRQIHALNSTIGQDKTDVMIERIQHINPDCQLTAIEDFISPDNVAEYISSKFDYVVEATDSVNAKAATIAFCKRNKIPIVTIGGAGGQIDPTQIQVADLSKTIQDPLAARVRNLLRRDYRFSKNPKRRFQVDCVYSTEQLRYPQPDGSVCSNKSSLEGSTKLDCNSGFGASVAVTASFGFVAVARVLEKLTRQLPSQS